MALDFNNSPYFDDYSESKKFYKILFKPTLPVQTRELNQLQTTLQKQIERFGSHIFKDGSVVIDGQTFIDNVKFITVNSTTVDILNNNIDRDVTSASGARIKLMGAKQFGNTIKMYYRDINGGSITFDENFFFADQPSFLAFKSETEARYTTGDSIRYSINRGVFFVSGYFVLCEKQSIFFGEEDKFSNVVGLQVVEKIVTSAEDESLLDNALNLPSFLGEGADRYFIDLVLTEKDFDPLTQVVTKSDNFIELSRFEYGTLVTVSRAPQYNEIDKVLAQRTYDESGDYTVKAFIASVQNNPNTESFDLVVEAGKAYVKGFDFETISPTKIPMRRATDVASYNQYALQMSVAGSYVAVTNLNSNRSLSDRFEVTLKDSMGVTIGSGQFRNIDFESGNRYRVYLEDVVMNTGMSFAAVRFLETSGFSCEVDLTAYVSGNPILQLSGSNVVKFNKEYIKTLLNEQQFSDSSYVANKYFGGIIATTNGTTATSQVISTGSVNEQFLGGGVLSKIATEQNYIVTVQSGTGFTAGQVLRYDNGLRIEVVNNSVTVTYPATVNMVINVQTMVSISSALQKTKSLLQQVETFTTLTSTMTLAQADGYQISSIIANGSNGPENVTNRYEFNGGQTDTIYDLSFIKLKPEFASPDIDIAGFSDLVVTYSYFAHTGNGFFSVDSYSGSGLSDSEVAEYIAIPRYKTSSGETVSLRDCIDFRPRKLQSGSLTGQLLFAKPGTIFTADMQHYLPRYDKLILSKERKLYISEGIPSDTPEYPADSPDGMTLYKIRSKAFTELFTDVSLEFIDHRRYTMRDIGAIEKRVSRIEYYTTLSLLEKQAEDEKIPSGVPGLDRFKNGILVDPFAGHSVGDVSNVDYACSIDFEQRFMRPRFSPQSTEFKLGSVAGTVKNGDLITLPFDSVVFSRQPFATRTVNLNPFSVFDYVGRLKLNPSSDTWVDTQTKPTVVVNINGENDAFTVLSDNVSNPASVGTRWSDWATVGRGVSSVAATSAASTSAVKNSDGSVTQNNQTTNTLSTTTTTTNAKVGLEVAKGTVSTVNKELGSRIVDSSIVPFIRSRIVDFFGVYLKPETKMMAMFDGAEVSEYCGKYPSVKVSGKIEKDIFRIKSDLKEGVVVGVHRDKIFFKSSTSLFEQNNIITQFRENGQQTGDTLTVISIQDLGSELETDEFGTIAGWFNIPNNEQIKFKTGEREFKIVSDIGDDPESQASFRYAASGLAQTVENTVISTKIQQVSVKPVLQTESVSQTSVSTQVTSTTVTLPPPVPPIPPAPPVPCGLSTTVRQDGRVGMNQHYEVDFGNGTGVVGINFTTGSVPDRFTIVWDGKTFTSGFVGSASFNGSLNRLGLPNVTTANTSGLLQFIKNKNEPRKGTVIVDAPFSNTGWNFIPVCTVGTLPNVQPTSRPFRTSASYNLNAFYRFWRRQAYVSSVSGQTSTFVANIIVDNWPTDAVIPVLTVGNAAQSVQGVSVTAGKVSYPAFSRFIPRTTSLVFRVPLTAAIVGNNTEFRDINVATGRRTFTFPVSFNNPLIPPTSITIELNLTRRLLPQPDPIAQTFFIDPATYPNGIFLESVDLFFAKKSDADNVFFQIRPTVNGYPSSKDIVPGAEVFKDGTEILTSTDATVPTNFKFENPIFLLPNEEYCFVIGAKTTNFEIYTAGIGDFILGTDTRVTEQPAIGSMFKSQNASTWTATQEEDVKFVINICKFPVNQRGIVNFEANNEIAGDIEYDNVFIGGETVEFAQTTVSYKLDLLNEDNTRTGLFDIVKDTTVTLPSRKKMRTGNSADIKLQATLLTQDEYVSPVLDISRLSGVLVKNIINNDASGEDQIFGGAALGRYITRRVVLNDGFESDDLRVYFDNKLPTGSSVKVYYKVATSAGVDRFEQNRWIEMERVSGTFTDGAYFEVMYKPKTESAVVDQNGVPIGEKFKAYAIKIVLLSSNPTNVPEIRNLRAIALDE